MKVDFIHNYIEDNNIEEPRILNNDGNFSRYSIMSEDSLNICNSKNKERLPFEKFAESTVKLSTQNLLVYAQDVLQMSREELVFRHFRSTRELFAPIIEDVSVYSCLHRITEEYLKRHGNPDLTDIVSDKIKDLLSNSVVV